MNEVPETSIPFTGGRHDRVVDHGDRSAHPAGQGRTAGLPVRNVSGMAPDQPTLLTVDEADRLAQERPPYPPMSPNPRERCQGPTGWHRPRPEDWNAGNRSSRCTWCWVAIDRQFCDVVWRTSPADGDIPRPSHDHKGFSEEKCIRCGWVMGRPLINCNNDDTPHVFPSQITGPIAWSSARWFDQ